MSLIDALRKQLRLILKEEMVDIRPTPRGIKGDYATNLPFLLAEKQKVTPAKAAEKIIAKLKRDEEFAQMVREMDLAGGGFLNFTLTDDFIRRCFAESFRQPQKFFHPKPHKSKKINLEFISANPTGPLHLGNGRGAFYGDVLANVLAAAGHRVVREYYVNDTPWSGQIQELGKAVLGKGSAYDTKFISQFLKKAPDFKDEAGAGSWLAEKILQHIKKTVGEKLRVKIDIWYSEKSLYQEGLVEDTLTRVKKRGLCYKKNGALWLKTSSFGGEDDKVLIRKTGQPTYFLSDLVYHYQKASRGVDLLINVLGADHQAHAKFLQLARKIVGYKAELVTPIVQMVGIKSAGKYRKLSKREGTAIPLEWLVEEIGLDAARFFYTATDINSHLLIDVDLAREHSQKNPVFYVQYAYVRSRSIKQRCVREGLRPANWSEEAFASLISDEERNLMKHILEWPEVLKLSADTLQIHAIPRYAMVLSQAFSQFYEKNRIIGSEKEKAAARLSLVEAFGKTLGQVLGVMGISRPEKM